MQILSSYTAHYHNNRPYRINYCYTFIAIINNINNASYSQTATMSLNFLTRFFTGKRSVNSEKEVVSDQQTVPIRRLSTSKSGKLKMRKVKSSQNIKDISFYTKTETEIATTEKVVSGKVEAEEEEVEDISVEEVLKEMYEVVQNGRVK